ncbi:MAG: aminoacyl-tRNA hydrolase [Bacillota bacterium]|jgi:PTH1 family peptidyl-tRNA hydrolase|nr:aminoacyl-tRNA hydrolase [Candidatus Fermentithermobacillaceae bacterium]
MKCIVGLGNPGKKYRNTRHNVGYMVLDEIAGRFRIRWADTGFSETALVTLSLDESVDVLLVRPLTYMNLSGLAVKDVMAQHAVQAEDVLVIHDDMDLPLGKVRLRRKGSSGGHRGIESIIGETGLCEFPRLKVGIGRPPEGVEPSDHVLAGFSTGDQEVLREVVRLAAAAALDVVSKGIEWAMSFYNGLDVTGESGGR